MIHKIQVELFGKEYIIEEPTVGQVLQMENLRMIYSGGNYNSMLNSIGGTTTIAIEMIDALSTISALIPDLSSVLKGRSLVDFKPREVKEICRVYKEKLKPFLTELEEDWFESDPVKEDQKSKEEREEIKNS